MFAEIDAALRRFESGTLSRRELIGTLAAMTVTGSPSTQSVPIVGTATQLNHATLFVRNVVRSEEFYQRMFGMPVLTRQGAGVNLRAGAGFIGLYPLDDGAPRVHHICVSINGFEASRVLPRLHEQKLSASIVQRGDTEELYFLDPDGITVQIQDTKYRGGVGRLGDRDPSGAEA